MARDAERPKTQSFVIEWSSGGDPEVRAAYLTCDEVDVRGDTLRHGPQGKVRKGLDELTQGSQATIASLPRSQRAVDGEDGVPGMVEREVARQARLGAPGR